MMNRFAKIIFPLSILTLFVQCNREDKYPDKPFLEFREAEFTYDEDTTSNRRYLSYKLYFTDGDGNLGSDDSPSGDCDTLLNNLFINYFEKHKGEYRQIQPADKCLPFDSQIPILSNGGSNPTLKGFINARFDYLGFPFYPGIDSIKLEFQIMDEDGNMSNIAQSGPIALPQP